MHTNSFECSLQVAQPCAAHKLAELAELSWTDHSALVLQEVPCPLPVELELDTSVDGGAVRQNPFVQTRLAVASQADSAEQGDVSLPRRTQ
jgi:hypothetical protein